VKLAGWPFQIFNKNEWKLRARRCQEDQCTILRMRNQ
jgi:hypothetical protein